MRYAYLVNTACDLCKLAVEEAIDQLSIHDRQREAYILIVGTKAASASRTACRIEGTPLPVFINYEWTTEWMLKGRYGAIFSEGVS